jgi:hypothetical protein
MKLFVGDAEVMLCPDSVRHLGHPAAVAIEYDVLTGDVHVRVAGVGDEGALALSPTERFGYACVGEIDEPPIEPGCYRLHRNRDENLTVDPHLCDT